MITEKDGTVKGVIFFFKNSSEEQPVATTVYSLLEDNIPGFKFTDGPCNVCDLQNISLPAGKQTVDAYDSPDNKCKFTVAGIVPEAYNVYMGTYKNTNAISSTPSSVDTEDKYKKCVADCDKLK